MLTGGLRFLRALPRRLRRIWQLVHSPDLSQTYYPGEARKSSRRALLENLWWLLRHREVNEYYYLYGLDRKQGVRADDFLPYGRFRKLRDGANAAWAHGDSRGLQLSYRFVLRDKFIYYQYLAALGFPVPRVLAVGDEDWIAWLKTGTILPPEGLLREDLDAFLKVPLSDGGSGVFPLRVENGRLLVGDEEMTLARFRAMIAGRYLIQERVAQHPAMSELNPHSVNTVRLVTARVRGRPEPFSAVLRMGVGDQWVDNWARGGLAARIDLETGRLGKYALFKPGCGTRVDRHPDTGTVFEGFQVPFFLDAVRMAARLHGFFFGLHSVGWDIAIARSGPVFLEGNDDWELGFHQAHEGGLKRKFMETLRGG